MRRRKPKAKIAQEQPNAEEVLWQVDWPSSSQVWGKTYFAALHRQTGAMRIITASKRRPASAGIVAKLGPTIQAAIERAQSIKHFSETVRAE